MIAAPIRYVLNPAVTNDALNDVFSRSWPGHRTRDFTHVLPRIL
jgi:hypothetical protein